MYAYGTQQFIFFREKKESCFVSKNGFLCHEKNISICCSKILGLTIFITCSAVEGTGELASSDAEIKVCATSGSIFKTDS